jgi:mannose-6-phosphate isomerase
MRRNSLRPDADDRPSLYPLTFVPALRDYIWGGRNLERLYGRRLPPGPTAESWEISAHPTASTAVDAGPLQGWTLPEVLAAYDVQLVGRRAGWALARGRFPLLVKLLDAEKRLSVQVHPPDNYALLHDPEGGELGKTEMWYVLHAEPGAQIILGTRRGVTAPAFRAALSGGQHLAGLLHALPVKAGDAALILPGTVHAALEGLIINEVLQNSDTTYRVYDWDRAGPDGQPRPLHIDQAMDVTDFEHPAPGLVEPVTLPAAPGVVHQCLASCRYFAVEKLTLAAETVFTAATNGDTLEMWGAIEGKATLTWPGGAVALPAIRYCLVPAVLGAFAVRAGDAGATLLRIYLPPADEVPA